MKTNLNTAPYYDDFDVDSNFHQILFKPGYAVQARELTQLQSILRDQVAKFGNHIFKHGSVVIPGNSNSDLNVCYVKLVSTNVNVASLEGKVVVGSTTGLRGIIRKGLAATSSDPATLYVSYYNSGLNNEKLFSPSEVLDVEGTALTVGLLSTDPVGGGSMAFISPGVFYVNGSFVSVTGQSIVIGKYTTAPSCHVLLKIEESIVNSDKDTTLLDPSQGSYNYAAPGADRLKISLTLTTLPLNAVLDSDYIEIMRFNEGVLEEHLRYPKYSELEKSLARRTNDESGDYVVSGLGLTVREHLRSGLNNGRYSAPIGDPDKLVVTTSAGKAYIQGFEQDVFSNRENVIDKTRGTEHIKTTTGNLSPSYGQTFFVTNITGLPSFLDRETVQFYNAETGGSLAGSASVISLDYYGPNTTETNAIFKLTVSDISIGAGFDIADIGRVSFTAGNMTVLTKLTVITDSASSFVMDEIVTFTSRVGTVHKHDRAVSDLFVRKHSTSDIPVIGDNIYAPSGASGRVNSSVVLTKGTNDNLLVTLPTNSTYRVKNEIGVTDLSYKIFHEATVTTNSSGAGSFSVTGMTIDPKEQGSFIISSSDGTILPLAVATVSVDGLSVNFTSAGANKTLKVICAATKSGSNAAPKTKTYVGAFSETGLTPSTSVALSKADIIRVISVMSSIDGDVTGSYSLDNGQRDYYYKTGALLLKSGYTAPTGVLTVIYDYFSHNAGSGDYFSVDSYEFSGIPDYYESRVLSYKSSNTSRVYNLRNVLDFRSLQTGLVSRVVQSESRLTTSIQRYVGRVDAVILTKRNEIVVVRGTPNVNPSRPRIPADTMHLGSIVLPPYVFSVRDVRIRKQNNRVYTMRDIGAVDSRVSKLEDYVLLNESEKFAVNYDIIDTTTGLSRFKSGYLVDTFDDPNAVGNPASPIFRATYDSGTIIPMFEVIEAQLILESSDANVTSDIVTLPYTEVPMISQPVSSKITNINPFAVFSWNGAMVLFPEVDVWVEVENLPLITENTTETIEIRRPYPGPYPTPIWDGTPDLRGSFEVTTPWNPMPPIPVTPEYNYSEVTPNYSGGLTDFDDTGYHGARTESWGGGTMVTDTEGGTWTTVDGGEVWNGGETQPFGDYYDDTGTDSGSDFYNGNWSTWA